MLKIGYLWIVVQYYHNHIVFVLKAPLLYQHDKFYREVSLQDCHYSFVIVNERDWLALKKLKHP